MAQDPPPRPAVEGRHRRRIRQAQHEAAKMVIDWAVAQRIGTLAVGDPRGVLNKDAGRRHNLRLRQWQIGRAIQVLADKAQLAGISVRLVDERGTSSTCPACRRKIPKPSGRVLSCLHCTFTGHRDCVRGGHHRHLHPRWRTHHPAPAWGGHAPSSRPTPTGCRPVPA